MASKSVDKSERENGTRLALKFDANGLITAVVSEDGTGHPLMVAYMNEEALKLSIETNEAHFYSRSRQEIWHKGATSGNTLKIVEMMIDCDQDAIWLKVEVQATGAACHTGRKSCFYRRVVSDKRLEFTGDEPLFDPKDVYG